MQITSTRSERRCALVVAHPGHEVRTFGWFERARPTLFVLTAGTRAGCEDRLGCSRRVAARVGAPLGGLFGRFSDRAIYEAILKGDSAPWVAWTSALAADLATLDPHLIVTDGWQTYNVSHDLVHVMARVAAEQAARRLGHEIQVLEYDTVPRSLAAALPCGPEVLRVQLDDAGLARKHAIAEGFIGLEAEVKEILALEGLEAQRAEIYREPLSLDSLRPPPASVPAYERFGMERVAAGVYQECIRWGAHVQPLMEALLKLRR